MYREYALTLNSLNVRVERKAVRESERVCVWERMGILNVFASVTRDSVRVVPFSCNYRYEYLASTFYKSTWHIFFQLLDTLPVCQDFNRQVCNRPACKFIHLSDGKFSLG